jgi:hypothetical protein
MKKERVGPRPATSASKALVSPILSAETSKLAGQTVVSAPSTAHSTAKSVNLPSKPIEPDAAATDLTVQVARIGSRQAIIVAVISALSGLIGIAIGQWRTASRPELTVDKVPRVLRILSIDCEKDCGEKQIRVQITVNNLETHYYPSPYDWAQSGKLLPQKYSVPGSDEFFMSAVVTMRSLTGDQTRPGQPDHVVLAELPIEDRQYAIGPFAGTNKDGRADDQQYVVIRYDFH